MKAYGANKATEFTKKQIGVIFANAKNGNLKVEKWVMSRMYDLAEYYGYDSNGSVAEEEVVILNILEAVFAKNTAKAQKSIDEYTIDIFSRLSRKNQQNCDHAVVA